MKVGELVRLGASLSGLEASDFAIRRRKAAAKGLYWTDWNRNHGALFIHVPKTAGTSVKRALGMPLEGGLHVSAQAIAEVNPQHLAASFSFAFLRDPLERFLSAYAHTKRQTLQETDGLLAAAPDLDNWDRFTARFENSRLYRSMILSSMHFCPQHYYVCGSEGRVLVDRLYAMDRLEPALAEISERLQIKVEPVHINSSTRAEDGLELTSRMEAILRSHFSRDMELLESI